MTVSDTQRRAELRGREAVAQSRLTKGVWAAHFFATLNGLTAIIAIVGPGGPHWSAAAALGIWSAALSFAAQRIEKGNRFDAIALFLVFVLGYLGQWLSNDPPGMLGSIISVVVFAALGNAVW